MKKNIINAAAILLILLVVSMLPIFKCQKERHIFRTNGTSGFEFFTEYKNFYQVYFSNECKTLTPLG